LPIGGLVTHACVRLAARQGLGRHGGKQGRRNGAAEVSNTGEAPTRARGCVCMHGFVRVLVAKRGGVPKLSGTRHQNEKEKDSCSKQGSARVEDGCGTCKATGLARWPALKRRREAGVVKQRALKARRAP
jgi:hypothetical protein